MIESGISDDDVLKFGDTSISYNLYVQNDGTEGSYVFIEFCSPLVGSTPLLVPSAGLGWDLYNESTVVIEDLSYKSYIFYYGSGSVMSEVSAEGGVSSNAFSSIAVANLSETQYGNLGDVEFHVYARAVMVTNNNSAVGTAWGEVPQTY